MPLIVAFFMLRNARMRRGQHETGSIAIEYALLAVLIAMAILLAVTGLGSRIAAMFDSLLF